MIKEEKVLNPKLDMMVFHDEIYNGKEKMKVVGIRKNEVELEGDYSGGTNNVTQKSWLSIEGLFRLKKVCENLERHGSCPLPNVHCAYPSCQPYI